MTKQSRLSRGRRQKLRQELYEKNPMCCWCGERMVLRPVPETPEVEEMATLEHLIPPKEGGSDERMNLLLAHKRCNR